MMEARSGNSRKCVFKIVQYHTNGEKATTQREWGIMSLAPPWAKKQSMLQENHRVMALESPSTWKHRCQRAKLEKMGGNQPLSGNTCTHPIISRLACVYHFIIIQAEGLRPYPSSLGKDRAATQQFLATASTGRSGWSPGLNSTPIVPTCVFKGIEGLQSHPTWLTNSQVTFSTHSLEFNGNET